MKAADTITFLPYVLMDKHKLKLHKYKFQISEETLTLLNFGEVIKSDISQAGSRGNIWFLIQVMYNVESIATIVLEKSPYVP